MPAFACRGKIIRTFLLALFLAVATSARAENIILLIGDGMGPEEVKAAGIYAHGQPGTLFMESAAFPDKGWSRTDPSIGSPTDSAASGTAMATGHKAANGVLGLHLPGDGSPRKTILEEAHDAGWATGLVTTTYLSHATPAAFGAHVPKRDDYATISGQLLHVTHPDVMLGGGHKTMPVEEARKVGYQVVTDRAELKAIDIAAAGPVAGLFGTGYLPYEVDGVGDLPHLHEMAQAALALLSRNDKGFFLMIEGGRIDHAGHVNDLQRNIQETIEFDRTVQLVRQWAEGRHDTLIVVTADHETGGLHVAADNGAGKLPTVSWTTRNHTAVNVPIFAWGIHAHMLAATVDNTTIHGVMQQTLHEAVTAPPTALAGAIQ